MTGSGSYHYEKATMVDVRRKLLYTVIDMRIHNRSLLTMYEILGVISEEAGVLGT